MISRFSIPRKIQTFADLKGQSLFDISKEETLEIRTKIKALRGDGFKKPDITIAIIAYNEEQNLFATLKSISEQKTNFSVEVILVDNNSSDNTSLVAGFCGVSSFLEKNQGTGYARQRALKEASGAVYVSVDADTIYPEQWLELLVQPLFQNEKVSTTYSLHALLNESKTFSAGLYLYQLAKLGFVYIRGAKRGQLNCGGASSAFRRRQALSIGGYNTELARGEDGYIALQLSEFGKIKMVSQKGAMVYTSNRRMQQDGSILNAFFIRFKYGMRHMFSFLSTQKIPTS
jgi:glycosyltransferase involved in cell wall biosynthesis